MEQDLPFVSVSALGEAYRRREVSPVEATELCLRRIEAIDPQLNAFITVTADLALEQARAAERDLRRGEDKGPLHGVPVAIKDLIDLRGAPTTFASKAGDAERPDTNAAVVDRLLEAGAVILGKTNLLEFAYGIVHPDFGQTNNPWSLDRTSGGSSSGSAAAVAAGLCWASVGTDTGGSIRIPAAYCGIAGLKPTYGLVEMDGVFPLSPTLDHVGPLARSAEDTLLMLGAMTGRSFAAEAAPLRGLKIGLIRAFENDRVLRPDIAAAYANALAALRKAGAALRVVDVPEIEPIDEPMLAICLPEASVVHEERHKAHAAGYAAETRGQIEMGFDIPATRYLRAREFSARLRHSLDAALGGVDVLVTPSAAWVAPAEDPAVSGDEGSIEMRYSAPFNLTGHPALSVPIGLAGGLPGALQLVARHGEDERMLQIAMALAQAMPPLGNPTGIEGLAAGGEGRRNG